MRDFIRIVTPTDVPVKVVQDTLCNAFEGGSTYWCDRVDVVQWPEGCEYAHEVLAVPGGRLRIFTRYEEEYDVDHADLVLALRIMASEHPKHFADMMNENHDADTGDLLFQLACFQDVVYG